MSSKKKTSRRPQRSGSPVTTKKRATRKAASAKARPTRSAARATKQPDVGIVSVVLERVGRYGVLRSLLAMAGVLLILFATPSGAVPVYSGWPLVWTVLVPVLAPLILMLLLLDALMGRVLMSDLYGAERARRRDTVIVNLLLAMGLVLRWLPYYLVLGQ